MDHQKVTDVGSEFGREVISNEGQKDKNWYEVRLAGKVPERRGYHSTFVIGDE